MISSKILKAARASLALVGGAALAAVMTLGAPSIALAQGKSNVTGCTTFSGFNYDASTNTLTVNNCATNTPAPPPVQTQGSFAWAQSTYSIATDNTSPLVVRINRNGLNGSNAGFYMVYYSVTPSATLGNTWWFNGTRSDGSVGVNSGVGFVDLGFGHGGVAGSLIVTLTAASGDPANPVMTALGSMTINVTAPVGSTAPAVPGCSTTATKNDIFQYGNQKIVMSLRAGETGSVAFTPSASSIQMYLSSSETVNTPTDADHEIAISTCPGDFTPSYPCSYQANYVGNSLQARMVPGPAYQCALQVGTTYYMNVRHVKLRDPSNWKGVAPQNSCVNPPQYTNGACEVRLQNTGL